MSKDTKRKQATNRFRVGSHGGCEAILYEFTESPDEGQQEPSRRNTKRIAATTFDEALRYLRWREPEFVIDCVKNLGLILLISGSPVD